MEKRGKWKRVGKKQEGLVTGQKENRRFINKSGEKSCVA